MQSENLSIQRRPSALPLWALTIDGWLDSCFEEIAWSLPLWQINRNTAGWKEKLQNNLQSLQSTSTNLQMQKIDVTWCHSGLPGCGLVCLNYGDGNPDFTRTGTCRRKQHGRLSQDTINRHQSNKEEPWNETERECAKMSVLVLGIKRIRTGGLWELYTPPQTNLFYHCQQSDMSSPL